MNNQASDIKNDLRPIFKGELLDDEALQVEVQVELRVLPFPIPLAYSSLGVGLEGVVPAIHAIGPYLIRDRVVPASKRLRYRSVRIPFPQQYSDLQALCAAQISFLLHGDTLASVLTHSGMRDFFGESDVLHGKKIACRRRLCGRCGRAGAVAAGAAPA